MAASVLERLTTLLDAQGVEYELLRHEPVYTSEEAAAVRGVSLSSGAKALVCRADGRFVMIVLPADLRLASKQVRKQRRIKSLRFANRSEVEEITGLEPGAIPPFGQLFGLETWCDEQLAAEPQINFNAGDHSVSIRLAYEDFARVEQPERGSFGERPDPQ